MKDFGLSRVVEPKNHMPVTSWKLDNSKKLKKGELRIKLRRIVFERENLGQIASLADFDVEGIKERLYNIVQKRGKLHNPYTESSGLIQGTVEEAFSLEELANRDLEKGDEVICMAPMAGIPLYIDKIKSVDLFYGAIECEGYAIVFEANHLIKTNRVEEKESVHLLRALEEEGNFCGIAGQLEDFKAKRAVIIGSNMAETILYAGLLMGMNPDMDVMLICDSAYAQLFPKKTLANIFGNLVREICFVDLSNPVLAAESFLELNGREPIDVVINMENIKGSESLSSLIVKDDGMVFYTSMANRYNLGLLVSDSLGKSIINYALDGFISGTFNFALKLLEDTKEAFSKLDDLKKSFSKNYTNLSNVKISHSKVPQKVDDFAFMSPITANMVEEVLNVAQYDCSVIIQGETGVGKEKIFNLLHQNSQRRDKPCIKINCATIQESLAESEFFGYEKGAFTGAQTSGKEGYFEMANNGTLFLDEIGALSLNMQSKLLRVLQENTYYKVGGTTSKHVNVRVICANNVPLKKLVDEGKFREDLYYRLNICQITVPPLRMRKEDITCLAKLFIDTYSAKYGRIKMFSADAYKQLEAYHWPGNVRELENVVHRLYISEKTDVINEYTVDVLLNDNMFEDTLLDIRKEFKRNEAVDFTSIIEKQEKRLIEYALKKEGTTRKAAEFLGLPQTTLARKKIKYGL